MAGHFTQHAKIRAGLMKPPVLRLNILSSPYFKPYFEVNSGLFLNCSRIISFLRKPVNPLIWGFWGQNVEKKGGGSNVISITTRPISPRCAVVSDQNWVMGKWILLHKHLSALTSSGSMST